MGFSKRVAQCRKGSGGHGTKDGDVKSMAVQDSTEQDSTGWIQTAWMKRTGM